MTLVATDIRTGYDVRRPAVIRGVSCTFTPGRVCVIAGPNGAGKSTLLRTLAGLITPWSGRVTLDGALVHDLPPARRARQVAYVPQRADVAFAFTAAQVASFGALDSGPKQALDLAHEALDRVGLRDKAGEPFGSLSAGQQQRATLARALVQFARPTPGTRVLLADEPLSAQDPASALRMCDLLNDLAGAHGYAVLCVMHDLGMATRIASDALLLSCDGEVAASGAAEDVLSPAALEPVFGVRFARIAVDAPHRRPAMAPTIVPIETARRLDQEATP